MMKRGNRLARVLSLVMVMAMLLTMMPASIFAVESIKTVYFQNNWLWTDICVYYWGDGSTTWPGDQMTFVENDGTYDIYSAEIPSGVTGIIFNGVKNDGSGNRDQTPDIKDDAIVSGNKCYYMTWNNGNSYGTFDYTPPVTEYAVTFNGTNVTSDGAAAAAVGENYTATLTAAAAYALPASVSVSVAGTELTEGYTYDAATGALTIDAAAVTGDIVITAEADAITYLKPNSNWLIDGARFAVYCFGNGEKWVSMTDEDGDGYYEVVLPEGYPNVIFCRMNPGTTANNWNNKWNQTADLTVPTDGTNCYTVKEGTWDKGGGTWSAYVPEQNEQPEEPDEPEIPAVTRILAGSGMFGTEWDPSNTANQMTLNADALYEKVYTNVAAGTYEFKVTDGTWDNCWPGNNYSLTVAEESNVTILFNDTTKEITVKVEMIEDEPEVPAVTRIIAGSGMFGTEWDPSNTANQMTLNADGLYEKVYTNVAAGTYEFKVTDGTWDNCWPSGNYVLTVEEESNVTILFNDATRTVEVKVEPVPALSTDYYLVGYLNNADYSGDEYLFVDGKLTVTFTADSYVAVKETSGDWYLAESYCTDTTVTLTKGKAEKMFVPAGQELTFTLVENGDGTLTLSYSVKMDVPEIPEGANVVTIHFLKPSNWSGNVNAWVWDDNGAIPGFEIYQTAWPGSPIPANADKAGWYDLVIGTAAPQAFNFIFNNGSSQTPDLTTGTVTGPTELWVVGDTVFTTAPLEWSHYTATIHFQKPADWGDTVNAYAWSDAGTLMGDWPGTVTSASSNSGWYNTTIRVKIGDTLNFIFNDGSGNQTADLTAGKLTGNIELWIDGSGNSVSAPSGWVDENRTVHVPGTFPGPSWDATSNQMTYDPTLGLYVITFKNVTAGTYEYKIAINGGWGENYGEGGVKDGNNIRVVVPTKQDVTVWYSDVTHRSVCSVDYDINAVVELSGTGIPAGTKMTDPNLSGLFTAAVKLSAGTYGDVTITFGDYTYTFNAFDVANDKEVTFYFEPSTYLAYHNASDVKVETDKIFYDSRDLEFKDPFGAVPNGEEVTFAIETGTDAAQISLIVKGQKGIAMERDGEAVDGVQRWKCTTKFDRVGEYQYYFAITNGSDMVFYTDDNYNNYYKKGDYGTGTVRDINNLFPYDLVVYYAGYTTPDWMKNAVIYQIFPDRFFDGNVNNNQAQTDARGSVDYEYVSDWYLLPENPEQTGAPVYVYKGDGEWSNEIYGGDLDGITQRIGYLKSLGVTVIYMNPVFSSISNHRYDACDYMEIDPILGTLGDFEELVAAADANGMKIILDGVFNHVSDDSVYFDRYYKFLGTSEKIGAYPYWAYVYDYMAENGVEQSAAEAAARDYFGKNYGITDYSYTEWFAVSSKQGTYADQIGLRAGKLIYTYEGWWGYDSMPVIKSTNGSEYQTGNWAEEIIYNAEGDSVTQYWISKGNDGWRLDVANEVSDETWAHFRNSVKALNSNAVIIGEIWSDSTHYLMGNMYDSVMNYVFRDAVAGFARGYLINRDNKAEKYDSDLTAEEALTILEILRERYPEEAFYAMMNLVGSHDTARILSYLDDVEDDRYQKDPANAFPLYSTTSERAKQLQYVVAFIQYTYAGAPTVYYGDEIGMVGNDDPDDRRAMEWGKGNQALVEWYAKLAAIRAQYPALRTGDVKAFAPTADVMGYVRSDAADTLIVMANRAPSEATVTLDLEELGVEASALTDLVGGASYTVADGKVTVSVPAYRGVILTVNVKGYSVNYGGLAPAYSSAYIVGGRPSSTNMVYPFLNNTGEARKILNTTTEDLVFEVEAVVNTFTHVTMDGQTVAREHYTVRTGSTIVTLEAAYLRTLALGDHEMVIHFQGGQTHSVQITVEEATKPTDPSTPSNPTKPSEGEGEGEDDPTTAPTAPSTQPTTPGGGNVTTGDNSGIVVWVMVMVVALAAIVVLILIGVKKKKK